MKLIVSRPVQLMLAVTLVSTFVFQLQPDTTKFPILTEQADNAPLGTRIPMPLRAEHPDVPWLRPQLSEPAATQAPIAGPAQPDDLPPLPPAGTLAGSDTLPPLPHASSASHAAGSDIAYLGRMIQDGKTQVFLTAGSGEPAVLSVGDLLDGSWLIQSISSTNVTLRRMDSGETRMVEMGGGAGSAQPADAAR